MRPLPDPREPTLERLTPAIRVSLTEAVVEQLAEVIVGRERAPGERLPGERDLAKQLGVSRIVVREALVRLSQRGLVDVRPGVGSFVARMPETSVTDPLRLYLRRHRVGLAQLFELRDALEPAIAAAASRQADATLLDEMARNVELTLALAERTDLDPEDAAAVEAFSWSDLAFHQLLAQASGNPLFELLLDPLIDRLLDVRRSGARLQGTARRAAEGHREVFLAVAARDPEAAAARMARHLREVRGWLTTAPASPPDPRAAADPPAPAPQEAT
ncbi:MAG: FadR/GntR family transcriptional regulator [Trueperaceae bacterium]